MRGLTPLGNGLTPFRRQRQAGEEFTKLAHHERAVDEPVAPGGAGELAYRAGIAVVDGGRVVLHPQWPEAAGADNDAAKLVRLFTALAAGTAILPGLRFDHTLPQIIGPGRHMFARHELSDGVSMVPTPAPGANSRGNHSRRMAAMVSLLSARSPKRAVVDIYPASTVAMAGSDHLRRQLADLDEGGKVSGSTRTGMRGGLHMAGAPGGRAG